VGKLSNGNFQWEMRENVGLGSHLANLIVEYFGKNGDKRRIHKAFASKILLKLCLPKKWFLILLELLGHFRIHVTVHIKLLKQNLPEFVIATNFVHFLAGQGPS
jgi:hypothetical protein